MIVLNFQRIVTHVLVASFIIALGRPSTLQAYNFTIDSFEVIKNGSSLFLDTFDDGVPPPGAAVASSDFTGGTAAYLTQGTLGPESGGKI